MWEGPDLASIDARTTSNGTTYRVRYRVDGRARSRSFLVRDKAEAWARVLEVAGAEKAEAMLEQPGTADARTVAEQVEHHIAHLTGVTSGTVSDYRGYARDLHMLAAIPITGVTGDDVALWVQWLEQTRHLSAKSIKNRHSLLSASLQSAVQAGLIPVNPARGTRLPRSITTEMVFLSTEEFARLLACVPQHYQPLTLALAGTGMRIGEATALQWRHVDYDAQPMTVRVMQSWKHTDDSSHVLGPPKTRRSVRTIAVPPEVAADLRERRGRPDEFIYTNTEGGPVRPKSFHDGAWALAVSRYAGDVVVAPRSRAQGRKRAVMERGDGERPRVHDLRHTFASWAIARGISLPALQRHLGHESIQTTVDRYGHLARADLDVMAGVAVLPRLTDLRELEA